MILKFDHAMNDALRMHDDFDPAHGHVDESAGFDHFQAFVKQGVMPKSTQVHLWTHHRRDLEVIGIGEDGGDGTGL